MSEKPDAIENDSPSISISLSLDELLREVVGRTREEKHVLLDRIFRSLIGDHPDKEYALPNPDDSVYLFLVPPHLFRPSWETPEFNAKLAQGAKDRSKCRPNSEVLARLAEMQAKEEQQ
jgi:hypothetical protein